MAGKSLGIFIPAYNAEKTLDEVFARIPPQIRSKARIVVIDDASKDGTSAVARKNKAEVIRHPQNKGYGAAQKTAFDWAIRNGIRTLVMLHADAQYAPEEMPGLIKPVEEGRADIVLGSRILGGKALEGGMPVYKLIGNYALTMMENLAFGTKIAEFHTGYRVFSVPAIARIPYKLNSDKYIFDSEILVQANDNGLRILELPIPTRYRSEISYLDPVKYGMGILGIVKKYLLHRIGLKKYPQFSRTI